MVVPEVLTTNHTNHTNHTNSTNQKRIMVQATPKSYVRGVQILNVGSTE